jgi:hypothetical protein
MNEKKKWKSSIDQQYFQYFVINAGFAKTDVQEMLRDTINTYK